ncbi:MAG: tetratricopeptide repeat protein [Bacteroidales bacterium]|jgi:tetratricopeptide (TPR) repeat protein|nr:tetratricopeptide repeat protein [Bacteroidales bacterium]
MSKENNNTENKNLAIGEVITKTERFIDNNKKLLSFIAIAIVAVIGGWFAYNNLVAEPREKNAAADLFPIQNYFAMGDYDKVLKGDGKYMGAIAFIDTYGSGKSSSLAKYYAGAAYLHKGEYQNAIDYLSDVKFNDLLAAPIIKMLLGDAHAELKHWDEAIKYYEQATKYDNEMTAPLALLKLGNVYEMKKDNAKALEAFKRIKKDYPRSTEYQEVEKYISRLEALQAK